VSTISVDYDVLNQKGSPAWFSDTFANIPTFGYKGRMFISIDTYAFYRDTGTGWDLIGGPGIGTLTGSGTTGQVSFFNGTQVLTGSNNLFWDNTNSRLGINTSTPGQALDIHSTANTLVQLNNTTTGDSIISFQNQNVTKWKIGNLYNANANSFDIYNVGTSTNAISISNGNLITTTSISCSNSLYVQSSFTANANIFMTNGSSINVGIGVNVIASNSNGFFLVKENSLNWAYLSLANLTAARTYTFPNADGTLALTSNLSAYLPLAGGTLTGALIGTSALFSGNLEAGRIGGAVTIGDLFVDSANNSVYVGRQSTTSGDNSKFYVRNRVNTLTALSVDPGGVGSVNVVGTFSTTRGTNLATATGNVLIGTTTDDTVNKLQVTGSVIATKYYIGSSQQQILSDIGTIGVLTTKTYTFSCSDPDNTAFCDILVSASINNRGNSFGQFIVSGQIGSASVVNYAVQQVFLQNNTGTLANLCLISSITKSVGSFSFTIINSSANTVATVLLRLVFSAYNGNVITYTIT